MAELELDLLNSQLDLQTFNAEIERRLGPLQRRIAQLEAELAEARTGAARRMLYGDRAAAADLPDDVLTQYRRAWGTGPQPDPPPHPPPAPAPPDTATEAELKRLYRLLAKRYHPDLTTAPAEKEWRAARMAEVNAAYAARDLTALRRLKAQPSAPPGPPPPPAPPSREQLLSDLRAEISRLEALGARLEQELDALAASPAVQLKLEATFARRAGRDLLGEMAADLQAEAAKLEGELAALRR
ncbi:MAG: hypothetical protein IT317_19340 [Anaerolineales bacterium]|nr:hypothetical protein [Anaerolineales bacterium]